MVPEEVAVKMSEGRRKDAFRLLVVAQDLDMSVAESREMIRCSFGLTDAEVCLLEQEGMDRGWPPL
jgi:hypothetical protein